MNMSVSMSCVRAMMTARLARVPATLQRLNPAPVHTPAALRLTSHVTACRSASLRAGRSFSTLTRASAAGGDDIIDVAPEATVEVVDEPVEATGAPPEEPEVEGPKKVVVLGGNGFVGSAVCKEALAQGLAVVSVSRSGAPKVLDKWIDDVTWVNADVFSEAEWAYTLKGASAVISCIGGFASTAADMERICGDATIAGVEAAGEAGVPRFVFVSVHDYNIPEQLKETSGYFSGKKRAEQAVLSTFPFGGTVLRPGFIYGDRMLPELGITVPLGLLGEPIQKLLALNPFQELTKAVERLPGSDLALKTPVSVESVAACALKCAVGVPAATGVVSVEDIATSA